MIVIGNHLMIEGLHISREKNPIPALPHTPIANLVEITKRLISPDSSARAPTLVTPNSNVAPGIGTFTENAAVHVLSTPLLLPKSEAHALYPKLEGEAHGRTHADAPIVIKV